jgi:hypothetical protein
MLSGGGQEGSHRPPPLCRTGTGPSAAMINEG